MAYKLLLMLLVVVQGTWHKPQVEHGSVASIYLAAVCVLFACLLPATVFSVLDRVQTATFLAQTAGQLLATAGGMHYLLLHDDPGHAVVLLQTADLRSDSDPFALLILLFASLAANGGAKRANTAPLALGRARGPRVPTDHTKNGRLRVC